MTTSYQVVYWRDIPAQIKARCGRRKAGRVLSERFQKAIDRCAMNEGATGTDDYLAEWRASEWFPSEGDLEIVLEQAARQTEEKYTEGRLRGLIENGGRQAGAE